MYYPLGYKPALDGLRSLAVVSVVLFHADLRWFKSGYAGVDLFFVISGFLITGILLKEHAETGTIAVLAFYRRRALRLVPALVVVCAVFLLAGVTVLQMPLEALREIAIAMLYASNWTRVFNEAMPRWLGHTWSLALEEQFYILWPLILLGLLRFSRKPKVIFGALAAMTAVVIAWRFYLAGAGVSWSRLYNGTDTRADALLFGAMLAAAHGVPALLGIVKWAARWLWAPALLILITVPTLLAFNDPRMFKGGFSVIAAAAAIVIASAVHGGLPARVLSAKPLVWIGRRSYGIYLWHYPLLLFFFFNAGIPMGWPLAAAVLATSIAVAAASYRFIERPFLARRYSATAQEPTSAVGGPPFERASRP